MKVTYYGKVSKTWEGQPECLFCGEPVTEPSADGPGVCGWCDCGCHRNGTKWTYQEYRKFQQTANAKLEEWAA